MIRRMCSCFSAVLTLLLVHSSWAEPLPPATSWVPEDAILVVEVTKTAELLDNLFDKKIVERITSLPAYKEQMAKPEALQAMNLINYFKNQYDVDAKGLFTKLTAGGITWAVGPDEANLLIVDAEDAKILKGVHEFFVMIAQNQAGDSEKIASAEYRGVTGYRFGPKEAHAIIGNRLLLTNKPEVLKAILDLRAGEGGASVATLPEFQAAKAAADPDSLATVFAKLKLLKEVPNLKKALSHNENPLATLLFAPLMSSLREGNWINAGLKIEGKTVSFEFMTDGTASKAASPEGFATPADAGEGALPNLTVPRQVAGMSFYRNLYQFYAAKDELFPERTSGLIFFENMMGIFFTGRDLTEEVLAETAPDVRVVVAEQEYDPRVGTPTVQLPGFAIVFRLKNPEKFAPIAEEAWQKALGLINFTRGQQALAGLILERPTHGDTRYTMSSFSAADESDRSAVDMRFNFQPSLAMPGEFLILSSCDALTRDLIDALGQETPDNPPPMARTHSLVEMEGRQLASILEANRDALIRQNMVEEGNTLEQAETQIGLVLTVLDHIGRVEVRAGEDGENSKLTFNVDVELP